MDTRAAILQLLADGRFHSGQRLGERLGVSRAAVWKAIRQLRDGWGIPVHSVRGRGYRLGRYLSLLDAGRIRSALPPNTARRIPQLDTVWETDSTNHRLLDRAREGEIHGHVLLAETQTDGRGRHGRQWHSPPAANLYLSLGWRFRHEAPLAALSLAVAVALWRTLGEIGVTGHGIKWPNDLWWQGRKLGGILLELRRVAEGPWQVVIGIGLNVAMPAGDRNPIDQPWVDLASVLGRVPDRNRVAAQILAGLVGLLEDQARLGMAAWLDDWHQADLLRDRRIRVSDPAGAHHGIARGIDESGALRLETPGGMRLLHAGEVSVRPDDDG